MANEPLKEELENIEKSVRRLDKKYYNRIIFLTVNKSYYQ